LAVAVNCGLLFMQKDKIRVLQVVDAFCLQHGGIVSEESMASLEKLWKDKAGHAVSWEEYRDNLESAAHYYDTAQICEMAESYCNLMHLEGEAAEYVQTEFRKLEGAFQNAAKQDLAFFAPYRMYVFEFITTYLLFVLNLEGVFLAVILTLSCIDMERSSRTMATVYSTRKGKKILYDKLFASVLASLFCFVFLAAATFLLAGCVFPVDSILDTFVSNPMVTLKGAPCITEEAMTIGEYILKSFGMSCILAVIYSLGSFSIGVRVKNGYYAFGMILIVLSIMKVFSSVAPTSTNIFFWTQKNPLDLALKAGTWFLYNANNFSSFGYERGTAALWLLICSGGCAWGLIHLTKKKY